MTRKSPPPPSRDADDDWLREVADVNPLGQRHGRIAPTPKPRGPVKAQPPTQTFLRPSHTHKPIPILSREADNISGLAENLDPKLLKDLAKGLHPPTATLDLHGLREGDAWLRLMDWISAAADNDHRAVLVITGKGRGYGEAGDMGIIKAQAPQWLAAHPRVMAFHTAQPRDGGSGALYVFLRRRR